MTLFPDSSSLYTSTVQSAPPLPMLHFRPTLPFKPLIPIPPILYFLPQIPHHRLILLAVSLDILLFLAPLIPSGFSNGILAFSEPEALSCYTFFRLIPLTLFVSRNLTLTYLPFSGSLDSLLCDMIAPTPSLAFSLLMPRSLAVASSFSSVKAYPSLNFLPVLILCLTPSLIV